MAVSRNFALTSNGRITGLIWPVAVAALQTQLKDSPLNTDTMNAKSWHQLSEEFTTFTASLEDERTVIWQTNIKTASPYRITLIIPLER